MYRPVREFASGESGKDLADFDSVNVTGKSGDGA